MKFYSHKSNKVTQTFPVKDRTKNKQGLPTFLAMERKLVKELKYA